MSPGLSLIHISQERFRATLSRAFHFSFENSLAYVREPVSLYRARLARDPGVVHQSLVHESHQRPSLLSRFAIRRIADSVWKEEAL